MFFLFWDLLPSIFSSSVCFQPLHFYWFFTLNIYLSQSHFSPQNRGLYFFSCNLTSSCLPLNSLHSGFQSQYPIKIVLYLPSLPLLKYMLYISSFHCYASTPNISKALGDSEMTIPWPPFQLLVAISKSCDDEM